MPGAKIPVIEVEKLIISRDGRGLYVYSDGDTFYSGGASTWTGVSGQSSGSSVKFLVAPSATGWLKVSYASSTTDSIGVGYIPVFPNVTNEDWK